MNTSEMVPVSRGEFIRICARLASATCTSTPHITIDANGMNWDSVTEYESLENILPPYLLMSIQTYKETDDSYPYITINAEWGSKDFPASHGSLFTSFCFGEHHVPKSYEVTVTYTNTIKVYGVADEEEAIREARCMTSTSMVFADAQAKEVWE